MTTTPQEVLSNKQIDALERLDCWGANGMLTFMQLCAQAKAYNALVAGGGWRPIESAPKGQEVLVWREDAGVFIAKLTTPDAVMSDDEIGKAEFPDDFEEWFSDAYGWQEGSEKPTHWMPLPPAPEQRTAATQEGGMW